jgi:copper chaperone for superoxide dismutase
MTLEKNVEFAVNIKCQKQVDALKKTLSEIKIEDASISKENKSLVVKSSLPSSQILAKIKGAGFEAAIKGVGPATGENISAAVCVLNNERIKGIIRFVQTSSECIIEGTIEGLSPGKHGINIHEHGDISNSCQNTGQHYNPFNAPHGGPMDPPNERHVGDLGNVEADNHGRAVFVVEVITRLSK